MKYGEIDNYFKQGLVRNIVNHNLYYMHEKARKMAILIIYLDDLLMTVNNTKNIEWFTQQLINIFKMFQLGSMKFHFQIYLSTFL
jgi:hypothetical protein